MSTQHTDTNHSSHATIVVKVTDAKGVQAVVSGASIGLYGHADFVWLAGEDVPKNEPIEVRQTNHHGVAVFEHLESADYLLVYLNEPRTEPSDCIKTHAGCTSREHLKPVINAFVKTIAHADDCTELQCRQPRVNDNLTSQFHHAAGLHATVIAPPGLVRLHNDVGTMSEYAWTAASAGPFERSWRLRLPMRHTPPAAAAAAAGGPAAAVSHAEVLVTEHGDIAPQPTTRVTGNLGVSLTRTETEATEDLPLWVAIRNGTDALSFNNYMRYINLLFCADERQQGRGDFKAESKAFHKLKGRRFLPFNDTDSYRVLKAATEAFVMVNCAVLDTPEAFDRRHHDDAYLDRRDLPPVGDFRAAYNAYLEPPGAHGVLPYLALVRRKLPDIPVIDVDRDEDNLCVGFVQSKLSSPCMVELIWSYWHEEAMLVQTMNAVTRRFQNIRSPSSPDPLANLEVDPLRPLSNLLWSYTQDEQHRLTVNRRNYEYDHHYGLRLHGRAVQTFRPADTRSQFLEAFHHLLRLCTVFYKQDDDTTVKADAFPVLNALKEVHLVMSQGAHNQFGDLPSTARIEMLMQQWLLGRPEFREFLPTRIMVAYSESWMDRVDAMKKIQGWTDTSVVHFHNLAIFGEQLLLTIRYGAWSEVYEPTQAFNWARFWRPQIQGYIHAYRAATGIDLGSDPGNAGADATLPSLLLQKRLAVQQRSA